MLVVTMLVFLRLDFAFAGASLGLWSSYLHLLSNWNYRSVPWCPTCFWDRVSITFIWADLEPWFSLCPQVAKLVHHHKPLKTLFFFFAVVGNELRAFYQAIFNIRILQDFFQLLEVYSLIFLKHSLIINLIA
jgi:hypothetical protein